jgi:hypothetical protein
MLLISATLVSTLQIVPIPPNLGQDSWDLGGPAQLAINELNGSIDPTGCNEYKKTLSNGSVSADIIAFACETKLTQPGGASSTAGQYADISFSYYMVSEWLSNGITYPARVFSLFGMPAPIVAFIGTVIILSFLATLLFVASGRSVED